MSLTCRQHLVMFLCLVLCRTSLFAQQVSRPPVAFPLSTSDDHRYLIDANHQPFIVRGRTAWYILSQTPEAYRRFLDDTRAKGFNAIEMKAITHDANGFHPPFAGNGTLPFLKRLDGATWTGPSSDPLSASAPDMTTLNEDYWRYLDSFLAECQTRGILVMLFPAYVGFDGKEQGWMQEMVANGADRMQRYGAVVARRYQQQGNLIWMIGGDYADYKAAELPVEQALIDGMLSVNPQSSQFYSAEWQSNSTGRGHPAFGRFINFNSVYSWDNSIAALSREAYAHDPSGPAFLLEEPYDEEGADGNGYNPHATQPVRRFIYWGWLNTIGGYMAGNGYIWRFQPGWEDHLQSNGAVDLQHLNALMTSIEAWRLVPSGLSDMQVLVDPHTTGAPDALDYVAAAATREGDLLLAYISPGHTGTIKVDLSSMGTNGQARWFDPTTGQYQAIGPVNTQGTQSFTTPGKNQRGDGDWVLRIDATRPHPALSRERERVLHHERNP